MQFGAPRSFSRGVYKVFPSSILHILPIALLLLFFGGIVVAVLILISIRVIMIRVQLPLFLLTFPFSLTFTYIMAQLVR